MYADLLADAVAGGASARELSVPELVERVEELRDLSRGARQEGRLDVATAVADELRYDTLLVVLCERVGIAVDLREFGRPLAERQRLERALGGRGVLPANEGGQHAIAERGAPGSASEG